MWKCPGIFFDPRLYDRPRSRSRSVPCSWWTWVLRHSFTKTSNFFSPLARTPESSEVFAFFSTQWVDVALAKTLVPHAESSGVAHASALYAYALLRESGEQLVWRRDD
jgi:hypothetical protein